MDVSVCDICGKVMSANGLLDGGGFIITKHRIGLFKNTPVATLHICDECWKWMEKSRSEVLESYNKEMKNAERQ